MPDFILHFQLSRFNFIIHFRLSRFKIPRHRFNPLDFRIIDPFKVMVSRDSAKIQLIIGCFFPSTSCHSVLFFFFFLKDDKAVVWLVLMKAEIGKFIA